MVKDYLEKIRQEYIEHKVSLEEQISSYENKVKENTKFLQVLEKETNPGYEAFSPREFNSFHKEKMEELRADQKRISNEIMCLRDQMQEYEFRIADITSVIKEETEIERKIHEAADIDSYDTRLALLRSVETERQRIARELHDSTTQNLTAIVHKTELCSKIIESDPVKCKLELFSIGQTLRKIIEDTSDSDDVKYLTDDSNGDKLAYVTASYFTEENKKFDKTYQMYVLRKDDNGDWKIRTFYKIKGNSTEEE